MAGEWSVEVLGRHQVGPGVIAVRLTSPPGFSARPGQFELVRGPGVGGRHYTISSPDAREHFELTVDLASGGEVAAWLAEVSSGDTIGVEGPFGRTYYDDGDAVAIGGGSGIGAAVGVAERAIECGNAATVVVAESLVHEPRLSALAAAGARVFVVTDRLEPAIAAVPNGVPGYVFGFRDFIDRVRAALDATGIDPDVLAYESYGTR